MLRVCPRCFFLEVELVSVTRRGTDRAIGEDFGFSTLDEDRGFQVSVLLPTLHMAVLAKEASEASKPRGRPAASSAS